MYIDIFLGLFVLIGVIQGFHRGIIRSVFAIVGIVVGLLAALKFSPLVVSLFDKIFDWDPMISLVLGLISTFLLIMWGIKWLGRSAEKTLKLVKLNLFNKLLGAVLYAGLMVVTYSAIIWFMGRTDVISEKQISESKSYVYLMQVPKYGQAAFESVKPVFKDFWDKMDLVNDAGEEG
jgi:membrane protein required for colicin V production